MLIITIVLGETSAYTHLSDRKTQHTDKTGFKILITGSAKKQNTTRGCSCRPNQISARATIFEKDTELFAECTESGSFFLTDLMT